MWLGWEHMLDPWGNGGGEAIPTPTPCSSSPLPLTPIHPEGAGVWVS